MQITLCLDNQDWTFAELQAQAPCLAKLLARARPVKKWPNMERGYADLFGLPMDKSLPAAAIDAAVWQVEGRTGYWLHADPVNLITDQNNAFLVGRVPLDDEEITQLVLDLNQFLFDYDCTLFAPKPNQWLFNLPKPAAITTAPVVEICGLSIAEKLPTGEDQTHWRRLFTELQMLLYSHPVNQKRRSEQKLTIDALWFWGEGELPAMEPTPWSQVISDIPFVHGLAYLTSLSASDVPEQAVPLDELFYPESENLIILGKELSLAQIEQKWTQPLFKALQKKQVSQLDLAMGKQVYRITSQQSRHWWRCSKHALKELSA